MVTKEYYQSVSLDEDGEPDLDAQNLTHKSISRYQNKRITEFVAFRQLKTGELAVDHSAMMKYENGKVVRIDFDNGGVTTETSAYIGPHALLKYEGDSTCIEETYTRSPDEAFHKYHYHFLQNTPEKRVYKVDAYKRKHKGSASTGGITYGKMHNKPASTTYVEDDINGNFLKVELRQGDTTHVFRKTVDKENGLYQIEAWGMENGEKVRNSTLTYYKSDEQGNVVLELTAEKTAIGTGSDRKYTAILTRYSYENE